MELLMGLNASVMPFSELLNLQTRVLSWRTGHQAGLLLAMQSMN